MALGGPIWFEWSDHRDVLPVVACVVCLVFHKRLVYLLFTRATACFVAIFKDVHQSYPSIGLWVVWCGGYMHYAILFEKLAKLLRCELWKNI